MRWTNYFIHPGDNRYYVFAFKEALHADEFEQMLGDQSIGYERHMEDSEWLFGVHRDHFQKALHCNHLVHANHRNKFIPVKGLRYGLLIGTAAMIALAIAGAILNQCNAQTNLPKWELGMSTVGVIPLEMVGYEPIEASAEGLTLRWEPQFGSGFGLRMHRNFESSWSLETGLETLRMKSNWGLTFQPENESHTLSDTLTLRAGRYRLPIMAQTSVPVNLRWKLLAGGGLSVDFLISDVFTTGYQQEDIFYNEYQVEENRQRRWTVPLRAELGGMYRPAAKEKVGFYLGCIWWREWSTNRWGEAQWERMLEKANVLLFMPQSGFAIEVRAILP
ncbi:MAG: hypothetical protein ACO3MV_04465 [Flavobacteriales bacterium]